MAPSREPLRPRIDRAPVGGGLKITAKSPLTPPEKTTDEPGPVEYVEVVTRSGLVVLTPVRIQAAEAVRARLADREVTEQDVRDAVTWAREASATPRTKGK